MIRYYPEIIELVATIKENVKELGHEKTKRKIKKFNKSFKEGDLPGKLTAIRDLERHFGDRFSEHFPK